MPYPRIIPHSDGAGVIDAAGEGLSKEWIGRSVWCYGAQSYRPFGTAAEYTVVPLHQAVPLPESVPMWQGACLGIRHYSSSRGFRGRAGGRAHRAGAGRCRCGRSLRGSTRTSRGRASHCQLPLGKRQANRVGRGCGCSLPHRRLILGARSRRGPRRDRSHR